MDDPITKLNKAINRSVLGESRGRTISQRVGDDVVGPGLGVSGNTGKHVFHGVLALFTVGAAYAWKQQTER